MTPFTTVEQVRGKFDLPGEDDLPDAPIEQSIADAHRDVMALIAGAHASPPVDEAIILAETYLAGAHLFRTLAAREAFDQQRVAIGRQRVEEGARFRSLLAIAAAAEAEGWRWLAPFAEAWSSRKLARPTDSKPVLGEKPS